MTTVLLTGATGFHGGAVLRALRRCGVDVRVLVRTPRPESPDVPDVPGDLRDRSSLEAACAGVDLVVHAAWYVGPDPDLCEAVNARGTSTLVAAAGVTKVLAVGTAAVYGAGPYRDLAESDARPAPVSAVSRSRLAGEEAVLAAGGTVLRPHYVFGTGDRWFLPTLAAVLHHHGPLAGDGSTLLSVVEVDELARATAELAVAGPPGGVLHAARPRPVSIAEAAEALAPLRGASSGGVVPSQVNARAVLSSDRWLRSDRLWSLVEPGPERTFADEVLGHRAWYDQVFAHGVPPSHR